MTEVAEVSGDPGNYSVTLKTAPRYAAGWLRESRDRLKAFHEGKLKSEDGEETLRSIEAELGR